MTRDELLAAYAAGGRCFSRADLRGADLSEADLREADLSEADLREANLSEADLSEANLREADLREADLCGAYLPHFQIPQEGDLIVWKYANGLVKLLVPWNARRTACLINRKCRAEFARVLWTESGGTQRSNRGGVYRVGEEVRPDRYCDDIRLDCSHGIHFFLTRAEAEEWK